jgi:myo-inositol-1(or 4)-monophosphatase
MSERFLLAKKLVKKWGDFAKNEKAELIVTQKSKNDFVTSNDIEIERKMVIAIKTAFPEDAIQGEEMSPKVVTVPRWIIDPIDGTKNYIRGLQMWSICVAYKSEKGDSFGIVYFPELGEFFEALEGHGAFLNGNRIHVSSIDVLKKAYAHIDTFSLEEHHSIMSKRWPLYQRFFKHVYRVRNLGAASSALTGVAKGSFDININLSAIQHEWDYFPSVIIITEAGGLYEIYKGISLAGNANMIEQAKKIIDKKEK